MRITVQLGDEVSKAAEQRILQAMQATESHDIAFNGDEIIVEHGDFTCIEEGSEHKEAASLFAFIQGLIKSEEPWQKDGRNVLVPYRSGFVSTPQRRAHGDSGMDRKSP